MDHTVKTFILLEALAIFFSACSAGGEKDAELLARAAVTTEAASREINLSDEQKSVLEETFYTLYSSIADKTRNMTNPSEIAEAKREANTDFRNTVEKKFQSTKATEVIAWYYNYSNGKN